MFTPDPAFASSSLRITALPLCQVRLQLDARWPWLILIPMVPDLAELGDLAAANRALLMEETVLAGTAVRAMGAALERPVEKLNIGALGNITRQLHVHVVGRRSDDPAWPGPVWGFGAPAAYGDGDVERAKAAALGALPS